MDITIHLDGSICDHRTNMPAKANIAKYWKDEKCHEFFGYFMDWGEPSCWACGKWNEKYDMDLNNVKDVFSSWNKHPYLDRCHIMARALGGCNCEANLALLCKDCHKASPDTKNIHLFANWVRNRKKFFIPYAKRN
jgi:hypothetical protein